MASCQRWSYTFYCHALFKLLHLVPLSLKADVLNDQLNVFSWFLRRDGKSTLMVDTQHTHTHLVGVVNKQPDLELQLFVSLRHADEEFLIVNHSRRQLIVLNHGLSSFHVRHLQKSLTGHRPLMQIIPI